MKKFSTKLKQKVGMIEKTIDPEFESEREQWKTFIDESSDVIKSLKKQETTIKEDIVQPLQHIDASLRELYGEDHTCYLLFQKVTVSINNALLVFAEEQSSELSAITEYVSEVSEVKKEIAERDAVLLDCDSAHTSLLSAQKGKDAAKTAHAEERYALQKQAYDDINVRLVQKLRDFRAQRAYRFDAHVQAITASAAAFFEAAETHFKNIGTIEVPKPARPANRPAKPTKPVPVPVPAAAPTVTDESANIDPFAEDFVSGGEDVLPKLPEKPTTPAPVCGPEEKKEKEEKEEDVPPKLPEKPSEAAPGSGGEGLSEAEEAERKKAEQKKKILGPRVLPPIGPVTMTKKSDGEEKKEEAKPEETK